MKLRIQDSATTLARLWWVVLLLLGGICVIAFSQITFKTDEKINATVLSIGTTDGITGKELFLIVKTDEDVTSKVTAKGAVNVGDEVTLSVYERILFRDKYTLE